MNFLGNKKKGAGAPDEGEGAPLNKWNNETLPTPESNWLPMPNARVWGINNLNPNTLCVPPSCHGRQYWVQCPQ